MEIQFLLNGMYATLLSASWSTFPVWKFCRCNIIVPILSVVLGQYTFVFSLRTYCVTLSCYICGLLHQSLIKKARDLYLLMVLVAVFIYFLLVIVEFVKNMAPLPYLVRNLPF